MAPNMRNFQKRFRSSSFNLVVDIKSAADLIIPGLQFSTLATYEVLM